MKECIKLTTDDIIVIDATKTRPNEGRVLRSHKYGEIMKTRVTCLEISKSEDSNLEVTPNKESQLNYVEELDTACKNFTKCGYKGKSLLRHLSKTNYSCKDFYDIDSLRATKKAKILERKRMSYEENRTEIALAREPHRKKERWPP